MKKFYEIDLVKIVACLSVVILHVCPPNTDWAGAHLIYLLGTYGVPLFFMVNGFLLYKKKFSFKYTTKKIFRLLKIVLIWGIFTGLALSVVKNSPIELVNVFKGAIIGKGILFHFWFLFALMAIYMMLYIKDRLDIKLTRSYKENLVVLLVGLEILSLLNLRLHLMNWPGIREFIYPSFRLITFGSYFYFGWILHNLYERGFFVKTTRKYVISCVTIILSFLYIQCFSKSMDSYKWASEFYDSLIVVIGCIAIFMLMFSLECKISNKKNIEVLCTYSMPIYILHPIVLRVVDKIIPNTGLLFCGIRIGLVLSACILLYNAFKKLHVSFFLEI